MVVEIIVSVLESVESGSDAKATASGSETKSTNSTKKVSIDLKDELQAVPGQFWKIVVDWFFENKWVQTSLTRDMKQ